LFFNLIYLYQCKYYNYYCSQVKFLLLPYTITSRGAKMKNIIRIIFVIALIAAAAIVAGGCASKMNNPSATPAVSPAGYQIKFFLKDKQVTSLGLADMQKLPVSTLSISGSTETGPTLKSVLDLAGITDFSSIKISGMLKGRLATGELTLSKADITDDVILDFNNQGKTKLCGSNIPDSNWIIDVAEIRAQ
jgi:hypothetical protein